MGEYEKELEHLTSPEGRGGSTRPARTKQSARHVRLYYTLLDSPAYEALNSKERDAYSFVFCRSYTGYNNGKIVVSNADVMNGVKCSTGTAVSICKALQHVGLIEVVVPGVKTGRGQTRRATEWRLTDFACNVTKTKATRKWRQWQPGMSFLPPKPEPATAQPGKRYRSTTKAIPLSQESDKKKRDSGKARKLGVSTAHDRSVHSHDRSATKAHIELTGVSTSAHRAPTATGRSPTSPLAATLNGEAHASTENLRARTPPKRSAGANKSKHRN